MIGLLRYYSREVIADMVASGRLGAWAAWAAVDGAWAYWVAWAMGDRTSEQEAQERSVACLGCDYVVGRVRLAELTIGGERVSRRVWHCGEPFQRDPKAGTCGCLVVMGDQAAGAGVVGSKKCGRGRWPQGRHD